MSGAGAGPGAARVSGLDGLRGVALLGMLAWHAEIGWVKGGFARMTIFFALSGFLATRSYLRLTGKGDERDARMPHPLHVMARFWVRRARRLLPVTVLGLAAAAGVTVTAGTPDMVAALRGDVLSVVGYVSNWRFVAVDRSYGALFERPSAFQHFWSLSLEEQCFLALPLVLAAALALGGRRRAVWVTAALAAGAAAVPMVVDHSPDAAYYGTHVRAAEFLAGAILALVLDRRGGTIPASWRAPVQWMGLAALAALGLVMVSVDRELPWLYRGGLALFALPAVAVIAAASERRGPVPRLLGWRPLAAIGRAAFPIYVLHWPLFVLVRQRGAPVEGAALVSAELAAAVAVGLVAHRFVERPLLVTPSSGSRLRPAWGDRAVLVPTALAMAMTVAAVWLVPVTTPPPAYDFAAAEQRANSVAGVPADPADARPAVALFGGSTAVSLGAVSFDWAAGNPALRMVPGSSQLGCGVVTEGLRGAAPRDGRKPNASPPDDYCHGWETRWGDITVERDIRLAVLLGGVWETSDWLLDGDRWTDITEPAFADLVLAKLTQATDILSRDGRHVLIGTTPVVGPGRSGQVHAERGIGPDHRSRIEAYNRIVRTVAAANDRVRVLEYGDFIDHVDPATAVEWLPDGIHPTEAASFTIWDRLLGPAIIDALPPAEPLFVAAPDDGEIATS